MHHNFSHLELHFDQLEKNVREHAGDTEHAWEGAGAAVGLEIWRIEKFTVVPWPKDKYGSFYDGDSYIVLHVSLTTSHSGPREQYGLNGSQTYKKDPHAETLSYDLHFYLGENTSQDEAGTAAYKTVELDDRTFLHSNLACVSNELVHRSPWRPHTIPRSAGL